MTMQDQSDNSQPSFAWLFLGKVVLLFVTIVDDRGFALCKIKDGALPQIFAGCTVSVPLF